MNKKSKKPDANYEVGYGKPPKAKQFKKGQSGNPKGRPKESASLASTLEKALSEKVEVRDGDRIRKMTKAEVMIQSLLARGIKGDQQAMSTLFRLMKDVGQIRPPETAPQQAKAVAFPIPMPSELLEALAEEYEYPTDHTAPDYLDMN